MADTRVKISSVVSNQLPDYVREDYPLVGEFLTEYYRSMESQGLTLDLFKNIDKYVKVDELTNLVDSTTLTSDVSFVDSTISVDSTSGFPESYGLIKIDSEIITYTGITTNTIIRYSQGDGDEIYANVDAISADGSAVTININQSSTGTSIVDMHFYRQQHAYQLLGMAGYHDQSGDRGVQYFGFKNNSALELTGFRLENNHGNNMSAVNFSVYGYRFRQNATTEMLGAYQ